MVNTLDDLDDLDDVNKLLKTGNISKNVAEEALQMTHFADTLTDIADGASDGSEAISNMAKATNGLSDNTNRATNIFTGLTRVIADTFKTLATNPFTYLVGGIIAGGIALHKYITAFDDALEKTSASQEEYANTSSEISSLNSELDNTKNRLEELHVIQKNGKLTIAEESELITLEQQNLELERQLKLKEKLAKKQSAQTVKDAMNTLSIDRINDMTKEKVYVDKWGEARTTTGQSDILTASKNELKELENLKKQRENLVKESNEKGILKERRSEINSEIETLDKDIERFEESVSENIESLSVLRESFIDKSTGTLKEGLTKEQKNIYDAITAVIDGYANINLNSLEKQLKQIENFFDGSKTSNTIKQQLLEIAKLEGESFSATDALHSLGITLTDLGITGKGAKANFDRYFNEMVSSAKEAEQAIKSIDGSVEGVKSAFESTNKDADWNSMSDYLKQAKDLYNKHKIGTDDFKSATQFISPKLIDPDSTNYDAQAYVEAWKDAQKKLKDILILKTLLQVLPTSKTI